MANANRPSGLSPVGYLNGSDWDSRGNVYAIPTTDGTAYFVGDPVAFAGSADVNGIATVALCAAGATAIGVILAIGTNKSGPFADLNDLTKTSAPATKTAVYYVLVADDPNIVYEVQEIGTGTALTATEVGLNANWVNGTPATGVKVSATQIDNATEAVTSTLNMKLLGLVQRQDNAFGAFAKYRVIINNHAFRTGVAGV